MKPKALAAVREKSSHRDPSSGCRWSHNITKQRPSLGGGGSGPRKPDVGQFFRLEFLSVNNQKTQTVSFSPELTGLQEAKIPAGAD